MGGRAFVDLPDGRRVKGYRKTLRRNPRLKDPTEIESNEPFRLTFALPDHIAGTVAEGQAGVIGVSVEPLGRVAVSGHGLEWVLKQASDFIGKVAGAQNLELRFAVRRGNYRAAGMLIYVPGASVIFPRAVKKALVFAVTS